MRVAMCLALGTSLEPSAGFASRVVTDPGCGHMRVPMRSSTIVYRLPHTFLRAGSDSVWR